LTTKGSIVSSSIFSRNQCT